MRRTDHVLPALRGIGSVLGTGCLLAAVLKNMPVLALLGFAILLTSHDVATGHESGRPGHM